MAEAIMLSCFSLALKLSWKSKYAGPPAAVPRKLNSKFLAMMSLMLPMWTSCCSGLGDGAKLYGELEGSRSRVEEGWGIPARRGCVSR